MLTPLIQNNLIYPQPSATLSRDRVYQDMLGAMIGLMSIRGLTDITFDPPLYEVQPSSTQPAGFIDGLLKLKADQQVLSLEPFDIVLNGTVLLDGNTYSTTFTITPIAKHVTTRLGVEIALQIEMLPNNKIIVPGCEPTSALSSNKLSSWMAQSGCGNALVDAADALEAIPGSWIKYGMNFNRGNRRQSWFVLPGRDTDCPCAHQYDYYQILKDLANEETPVEENFDACDVIGMGYCPSPDFDTVEAPPDSPYKEEGVFPAGVGVLPPIPPWGLSGT